METTKREINQLTEHVKHQNHLVNKKENQIDTYTKELLDLENCLSTTQDELINQHTKVDESKSKVKLLTQKMHKLIADEKPLMKEISHHQKQVAQNGIIHTQLELHLKQNETKIIQYKSIISKLTRDSKQNDRLLVQENLSLQQCHYEQERSKENMKKFNNNLKYSQFNYQNLKEIFNYTENENKQLKQQYEKLTSVVQLLGHRHAIVNNDLKPLYEKIKYLTEQHLDKGIY